MDARPFLGAWEGCGPGSWVRIRTTRVDDKGTDVADVLQTLIVGEGGGLSVRSSCRGYENDTAVSPFHPMGSFELHLPLVRLLDEKKLPKETLDVGGIRFECSVAERRALESPQCGNDESTGTLIVERFWSSPAAAVCGGILKRSSREVDDYEGKKPREQNPRMVKAIVRTAVPMTVDGKSYSVFEVRSELWDYDYNVRMVEEKACCAEIPCGWIRQSVARKPFDDKAPAIYVNDSEFLAFERK